MDIVKKNIIKMNIVFLRHGDAEASFLFYFELPLLTTRANNAPRRCNRSGHAFRTPVYRKRFLRIQFLREAISQTHQNMAGARTGENMGWGLKYCSGNTSHERRRRRWWWKDFRRTWQMSIELRSDRTAGRERGVQEEGGRGDKNSS